MDERSEGPDESAHMSIRCSTIQLAIGSKISRAGSNIIVPLASQKAGYSFI